MAPTIHLLVTSFMPRFASGNEVDQFSRHHNHAAGAATLEPFDGNVAFQGKLCQGVSVCIRRNLKAPAYFPLDLNHEGNGIANQRRGIDHWPSLAVNAAQL